MMLLPIAVTNAITVSGFDRFYSRYVTMAITPYRKRGKRASEFAMTQRHHGRWLDTDTLERVQRVLSFY